MELIITDNYQKGSKKAFEVFDAAYQNGAQTFGLATGSTPVALYDEIANSDLDFSQKVSVNLDEYVGLSPEDSQSYAYFMQEHLFQFKPFANSWLPNGIADDLEAEAKRYDKLVFNSQVDIQILGLGKNGHIGFNEPGTSFESHTHLVDLTESTIRANSRFFDDINQVPKRAISMGLKTIMNAKQILLMAFGSDKADAVQKMIEEPQTTDLPASILKNHDNVTVIIDTDAAAKLK
ncbi:MAG: glucosamine-6-phosphate deaminase [Lactobacillaceae bacterium]|jgi:glucosamine-6-phosphate deaminase|nr:glucosamine-6-phosphate deaminase [Lactobacillaceae bacterium]